MLSMELRERLSRMSIRETAEVLKFLAERIEQEVVSSQFSLSQTGKTRSARIDAVCGKYRDVPTSSDAFAARKSAEKALEERRWRG